MTHPLKHLGILILCLFLTVPAFAQEYDDEGIVDMDIPQEGSEQIQDTEENQYEDSGYDDEVPVVIVNDALQDEFNNENGFTGTYSDEDPDNQQAQEERKLFGDDEASDGASTDGIEASTEEETEDGIPSHLLTLNFDSHVIVTDKTTGSPYIEINYSTKLEQEVEIKKSRFRVTGEAEFSAEIIGQLAGNELFSCKLEIDLENVKSQIMTRYNVIPETEDTLEEKELAVQIKFDKKPEEDWFSDCLAVDGSVMKTQGNPEEYLYLIWESITPNMNGILFENYDINTLSTIDLVAEAFIIDDEDTKDEYSIFGEGELTVEPL